MPKKPITSVVRVGFIPEEIAQRERFEKMGRILSNIHKRKRSGISK